jgi:hypothetical protein
MRAYLGIDGGGTKTDFLLIDATGHRLASHRAGSAYYLETGVEVLEAMLATGIRETLQEAEVPAEPGWHLRLHRLARHGEDSALLPRLDRLSRTLLPPDAASLRQRHGVRLGGRARRPGGHQPGGRYRFHRLRRVRRDAARASAAGVNCSATRAQPIGWRARPDCCFRA